MQSVGATANNPTAVGREAVGLLSCDPTTHLPNLAGRVVEEADTVEVLGALRDSQIRVVVEGGWAVDALVGHQTRPHRDLDVECLIARRQIEQHRNHRLRDDDYADLAHLRRLVGEGAVD